MVVLLLVPSPSYGPCHTSILFGAAFAKLWRGRPAPRVFHSSTRFFQGSSRVSFFSNLAGRVGSGQVGSGGF